MAARSPGRALAEPRREGRGVEDVAGVEQGRQQDRSRPGETARDVADGRELGRAGEDEQAHRHRLDRAEARRRGPPGRRRSRSPWRDAAIPSDSRTSWRRGGRRAEVERGRGHATRSAQEGLAAGPVTDDVEGVQVARVAQRRGAARDSPWSGTSRPTSGRSSLERESSRQRSCRPALVRFDERGDGLGPLGLRSRWYTGSSGRRWTTRIPPEVDGSAGGSGRERSPPPVAGV